MDLGSWGKTFRDATEAMQLKGLDEMAAEDEYVHSEGLNVKRQESDDVDDENDDKNNQEMVPLTSTSHDVEMAVSSGRQPLHAAAANNNNNNSTPQRSAMAKLDNKSNTSSHHNSNNSSHAAARVRFSDDEKSSSDHGGDNDDELDDPVYSFMRKQKERQPQDTTATTPSNAMGVLEMEMSESSESFEENAMRQKQQQQQKSKQGKHRFLEDLDNRLAKTNEPMMQLSSITSSGVKVTISSTNSNKQQQQPNGARGWFMGLAGANKSQQQQGTNETTDEQNDNDDEENGTLPPLSRQRLNPKPKQQQSQSQEEEPYAVVTSSGMLDADDLMALEQMKHLNESRQAEGIITTRIKQVISAHPRESFIALTLVLAVLVYFYLRHVSAEDDVQ